jgi:hypothetical protein
VLFVLGSKYYIHYANEQLLLRWSTLSRLSDFERRTSIELIQPYYELERCLDFIERHLSTLKSLEQRYLTNRTDDTVMSNRFFRCLHDDLLCQWRLPDTRRTSIRTWDDIVTNRALFLDVRT